MWEFLVCRRSDLGTNIIEKAATTRSTFPYLAYPTEQNLPLLLPEAVPLWHAAQYIVVDLFVALQFALLCGMRKNMVIKTNSNKL